VPACLSVPLRALNIALQLDLHPPRSPCSGDANRVLAEAVRQEAVAGEFSQIEMGRSRIWEFEKRGGAKQVGLD
jgi:hypothetical protein